MTDESVTLPTLTVARLVAAHVNDLWMTWANDTEWPGCCYNCCASCAALKDLHGKGQLDELCGVYIDHVGGTWSGWDAEKRQAGGDWLTEAWSVGRNCCPEDRAGLLLEGKP